MCRDDGAVSADSGTEGYRFVKERVEAIACRDQRIETESHAAPEQPFAARLESSTQIPILVAEPFDRSVEIVDRLKERFSGSIQRARRGASRLVAAHQPTVGRRVEARRYSRRPPPRWLSRPGARSHSGQLVDGDTWVSLQLAERCFSSVRTWHRPSVNPRELLGVLLVLSLLDAVFGIVLLALADTGVLRAGGVALTAMGTLTALGVTAALRGRAERTLEPTVRGDELPTEHASADG